MRRVLLLILQVVGECSAKRKKQPKLSREEIVLRQQDCEMCGLVVASLEAGLQRRQADLQLSREAVERRQAYVDGVQKAQTKRWLKGEYGVEMAAAVEDVIDGMCEREADLVNKVCGLPNFMSVSDREVEVAKLSALKQPYRGTAGYTG
jgi:hypothetical protein